jgi:uncharacterized membrane protein YeiH
MRGVIVGSGSVPSKGGRVLLLQIGDYIGTFVFGLTGALAAAEKRLDLGGFVLLACVTGVGGGTMRDVLLDRDAVFWAVTPLYLLLCTAAAVVVFVWGGRVRRVHRALLWADAAGLALFAVIGAGIAIQTDARPAIAVVMGTLTATGGGLLRDVLRNQLPLVLHREIYVTAAFAGSLVFVLLDMFDAPWSLAAAAGGAAAFALRAAGILFDLHMPVRGPGT